MQRRRVYALCGFLSVLRSVASNEAGFLRQRNGPRPVIDAKFGKDMYQVGLDGGFGNEELSGHFFIGGSRGHQSEDFAFAFCQFR